MSSEIKRRPVTSKPFHQHHHDTKQGHPHCFPMSPTLGINVPEENGNCVLCFEPLGWVAKGECGHAEVCWLCALRLRWIIGDLSCPLCKVVLNEIDIRAVGVEDKKSLIDVSVIPENLEISTPPGLPPRRLGKGARAGNEAHFPIKSSSPPWTIRSVRFGDSRVFAAAESLVSYGCVYCSPADAVNFKFSSLSDLQTHLLRDHDRVYCSICLTGRRSFLCEQYLFTSSDLERHKRNGDSHLEPPIDAHPVCEFCKGQRFFGEDELRDHLRKNHFLCGVCEWLGWRGEWYSSYNSLNAHYQEAHYPCPEHECIENRFVVFPDEEGLRLHRLDVHVDVRGLSKSERRSAMTLSLQGGSVGSSSGGVVTGSRKKTRNPAEGRVENRGIHFRGAKTGVSNANDSGELERRYPDVSGVSYRSDIHSKLPISRLREPTKRVSSAPPPDLIIEPKQRVVSTAAIKPNKMLTSCLSRLTPELLNSGTESSASYRSDNKALREKLCLSIGLENEQSLQATARGYKSGRIPASELLDVCNDFFSETKGGANLLTELIRLAPTNTKQNELLSAINLNLGKGNDLMIPSRPAIDLSFEDLTELGVLRSQGRLSFLAAVVLLFIQAERPSNQPQIRSLRNLLSSQDAVQLETLSEIASHLNTIERNLSLQNVDGLIALRPLFHRVMHIPEDRVAQVRPLTMLGWKSFVKSGMKIVAKFSNTESIWVAEYLRLALDRLKGLGAISAGRLEFPDLPKSAFIIPGVTTAVAPRVNLNSNEHFPSISNSQVSGRLGGSNLSSSWRSVQNVSRLDPVNAEIDFPSLAEVFPGRVPSAQILVPQETVQTSSKKKKNVILSTAVRRNR